MVAGEVESSCQLVATFFFLVSPYQTIEISLGQPSPPSYQLLPLPLRAGMKQLAIAMYGPVWAGVTLTSQWRHTVAKLKQISDCSQLNQELTAQCLSNQPARYGQ